MSTKDRTSGLNRRDMRGTTAAVAVAWLLAVAVFQRAVQGFTHV